ncbi:hypothetical protein D9M72_464680 [compost metagenome]
MRALRVLVVEKRGDVVARRQLVEKRGEFDSLALEVVVAGDLVRIDAAAHGVLRIGERCRRQRDFELQQFLFARDHIAAVESVCRYVDGIVLRVEADLGGIGEDGDRRLCLGVHAFGADPDVIHAGPVVGFDRLGDVAGRANVDIRQELPRVGKRRAQHRRQRIVAHGAGNDRIEQLVG